MSTEDYANGLKDEPISEKCVQFFYKEGECDPLCREIALASSQQRGSFNEKFFAAQIRWYGVKLHAALTGKSMNDFSLLVDAKHIVAHIRKDSNEYGYKYNELCSKQDYDIDLWIHLGNRDFPEAYHMQHFQDPIKIESKTSTLKSIHDKDGERFQISSYKPALNEVLVFTTIGKWELKHWYTSSQNLHRFLEVTDSRANGYSKRQHPDWMLDDNLDDAFAIGVNHKGELIAPKIGDSQERLEWKNHCGFDDLIELNVDSFSDMSKFIKFCANITKRSGSRRMQQVINRANDRSIARSKKEYQVIY